MKSKKDGTEDRRGQWMKRLSYEEKVNHMRMLAKRKSELMTPQQKQRHCFYMSEFRRLKRSY
jgi:hypothetical protein